LIILHELKARAFPTSRQQTTRRGAAGVNDSKELLDLASEVSDLRADVRSQSLESDDASQGYERCRNCVFRKFKTGFICEKSLNHVVAPFRFD
jgi:hypothetical protein